MVGAAEAHQVRTPGVVARQAHGLHHRFGAGHVEGHRIQPGDRLQPLDVARHHRVVAAKHRAERLHPRAALGDAGLVEVHAEQVDAIGAGQVMEDVGVQVGERDALGRPHEAAHLQVLPQQLGVLEGHAVAAGELQVGQGLRHLGTEGQRLGIALAKVHGQPLERGTALHDHGRWCPVGSEEALLVVAVAGQPRGYAARHARMAGQRRVLGPRQLKTALSHWPGRCGSGQCQGRVDDCFVHRELL